MVLEKKFILLFLLFLAWAWLAKTKGRSCHTKKINPCQNIYEKKNK